MKSFIKTNHLSTELFQRLTEKRVLDPDSVYRASQKRKRRSVFVPDGRINIVAADHPARGSLGVGSDEFAMADRHDLLARLLHILQSEWVDGVLAGLDILEELLMIHDEHKQDGRGFLDQKLLIASFNRGGLPGAKWELDDPLTGPDADTCIKLGLDAGKVLLRVDLNQTGTLKTLQYCASMVREMNRVNLPFFLEPLPVDKAEDGFKVSKDPERLIKLIGISSALGNSSMNSWLKIPFTNNFKRVLGSTTLPVVILGGSGEQSTEAFLTEMEQAFTTGHQVRGAMVGRNVLYAPERDPKEVAEAIGKMVHSEKITVYNNILN